MATLFLKTKLYAPVARSDWVTRHRLIQRLNDGLTRRITLLSAPAGYGKTTLLSSWLDQLATPVAWLTLDDSENDPVLFLSHLVASLQNDSSELMDGLASAFKTPQPIKLELFLTKLINRILSIPHRIIVVLEDYHCLTAQPVHDTVNFLIDHQPPNMHLVIATRTDPLLPLARLRGRGQITEIRQEDLRTTHEEATAIAKKIVGEELDAESLRALIQRTEGWVTGLQLAALSLRITESKQSFITDFSGRDTLVADYFAEEVIKQLPENIYTFLLQTSILDRLSGALCEAVTGQQDSQKTLQWLLEANFFVVSLDNQQAWYRYHQLFADLLRSRLYQLQPALAPVLHIRASQWYEAKGLVDKAIDHAMEARDFQRAADLVARAAEITLMEGRVATFMRWVEALPAEICRENPVISVYILFLQVLRGTPSTVILARLKDVELVDSSGTVAGEIMLIRAYIGLDKDQSNQLSQRALELLPPDRTYFRGIATAYYGAIQVLRGELELARRSFSEVVRTSQRAENIFLTVMGFCRLAEIAMFRGQLHEAEAAFMQALGQANDIRGEPQPLSGEALIGLGRVYYERNELDMARRYLIEGIELASIFGEIKTLIAHITLANILLMEGESQHAHQAMLRAQLIAENSANAEIHLPVYRSNKIRFELHQGDIETALQWAEQNDLPGQDIRENLQKYILTHPFPLLQTSEVLSLAMLRLAQGECRAAMDILDPLLEIASQAGWQRDVLLIQVQRALAFKRIEDSDRALDCLGKALSIAEPEGYVRPFIEQGRQMFELLYQAAGRGISPGLTRQLLAEFRRAKNPAKTRLGPARAQHLIESLTAREIEVLRLLGEGYSNQEIAERLVISPGTVKKHLDRIYGKLGAHNRTEAVVQARELDVF